MKFLIIGSTKGNIDIVNDYIDKSKADCVLSVGDFGLSYRNNDKMFKYFKHNNFYEYLEGKKHFKKPVYIVRGPHDNLSLYNSLLNNKIKIDNFNIIPDGSIIKVNNNSEDDLFNIKEIVIGGIGGSYSPTNYDQKLFNSKKRYFNYSHIESIKKQKVHIMLMYDVLENLTKKKISYSDNMIKFIDAISPFYYIVGKYDWWGISKIGNANLIAMPSTLLGYLVLDTKEWNAEGVRTDIKIFGDKSES